MRPLVSYFLHNGSELQSTTRVVLITLASRCILIMQCAFEKTLLTRVVSFFSIISQSGRRRAQACKKSRQIFSRVYHY